MSGTHGALRLIELTSARLCHDISGLVGSLDDALSAPANGGALDPNFERAAAGAAHALTSRLELCSAAWGPEGNAMSLARIRSLAAGLPEKVTVDVSALDPDTLFSASTGRIVLNVLLLAADSLPSGGTVILAGGTADVFFRIAGPAAGWPAGMAVCVVDEVAARSALTEGRSLQMALTALLAHAAGTRLSVVFSPTGGTEPAILRLGG